MRAGGLHIVSIPERHESRRIDNQLRARPACQGDPGSSRFFLSLEDDLMRPLTTKDALHYAGSWYAQRRGHRAQNGHQRHRKGARRLKVASDMRAQLLDWLLTLATTANSAHGQWCRH